MIRHFQIQAVYLNDYIRIATGNFSQRLYGYKDVVTTPNEFMGVVMHIAHSNGSFYYDARKYDEYALGTMLTVVEDLLDFMDEVHPDVDITDRRAAIPNVDGYMFVPTEPYHA